MLNYIFIKYIIYYILFICIARRIMVQSVGAKSEMVKIHLLSTKFGFLGATGHSSSSFFSSLFLKFIIKSKNKNFKQTYLLPMPAHSPPGYSFFKSED